MAKAPSSPPTIHGKGERKNELNVEEEEEEEEEEYRERTCGHTRTTEVGGRGV